MGLKCVMSSSLKQFVLIKLASFKKLDTGLKGKVGSDGVNVVVSVRFAVDAVAIRFICDEEFQPCDARHAGIV